MPQGAELLPLEQAFRWCERDEAGELHGALRVYALDGTARLEQEYVHGKRHGAFRRFHASGALAEVGRYFDDLRDGFWVTLADGDSSASIRDCCIPEAARRLHQEYRRGRVLAEVFFSATGEVLEEPTAVVDPRHEPLRERAEDVLTFSFGFWPGHEPLPSSGSAPLEPAPERARVEQTLPELAQAIRRAAARVMLYRAALACEKLSLAPPDVSFLLDEAVELRRFEITPEGEESALAVDERPCLPEDAAALALEARIAWSGLCWLCWAAGMDELALPTKWRSRHELHDALLLVSSRAASLRHHAAELDDAPHFHGLDESLLPGSALAQLARHYEEARAMLLFASDPECVSPWQDDLGRGG